MCALRLGPCLIIQRFVPGGRRRPGEIGFHRPLHQAAPRRGVPVRRQGAVDHVEHVRAGVRLELESGSRRGRVRLDRIGQPPRGAHHGDRAVAQTVELVESARLIPRRHEKHVRPGLRRRRQSNLFAQRLLALELAGGITGAETGGDVRIGLGIPDIVVDAVGDTGQVATAPRENPLHAKSVLVGSGDLFGVARAHRRK